MTEQRGFTVWFTGLSGAGKSTIAEIVGRELEAQGVAVEYLDGDVVREHLSKGLGFTKEDRDIHIARIGWLASRFARHGVTVIAAVISPFAETRAKARELVEDARARFVEIHVATPLDECERRDVKGLYSKARRGDLPMLTGVSHPYEEPESPELRIETEGRTPEECAREVLEYLAGVPA
jgi:adenylylsulfate kinase